MATLKISDLSVGDWVECEDVYCKVSYILPNGIIGTTCRNHRDGYEDPLTNLHPIPITAEILGKIGFGKKTFTQDQLFRIVEPNGNMPFIGYRWDSRRVIIERDNDYMLRVKVEYVHQLQHALRIAGVDKEINL